MPPSHFKRPGGEATFEVWSSISSWQWHVPCKYNIMGIYMKKKTSYSHVFKIQLPIFVQYNIVKYEIYLFSICDFFDIRMRWNYIFFRCYGRYCIKRKYALYRTNSKSPWPWHYHFGIPAFSSGFTIIHLCPLETTGQFRARLRCDRVVVGRGCDVAEDAQEIWNQDK